MNVLQFCCQKLFFSGQGCSYNLTYIPRKHKKVPLWRGELCNYRGGGRNLMAVIPCCFSLSFFCMHGFRFDLLTQIFRLLLQNLQRYLRMSNGLILAMILPKAERGLIPCLHQDRSTTTAWGAPKSSIFILSSHHSYHSPYVLVHFYVENLR